MKDAISIDNMPEVKEPGRELEPRRVDEKKNQLWYEHLVKKILREKSFPKAPLLDVYEYFSAKVEIIRTAKVYNSCTRCGGSGRESIRERVVVDSKVMNCDVCHGSGVNFGQRCTHCGGRGQELVPIYGYETNTYKCSVCDGTGRVSHVASESDNRVWHNVPDAPKEVIKGISVKDACSKWTWLNKSSQDRISPPNSGFVEHILSLWDEVFHAFDSHRKGDSERVVVTAALTLVKVLFQHGNDQIAVWLDPAKKRAWYQDAWYTYDAVLVEEDERKEKSKILKEVWTGVFVWLFTALELGYVAWMFYCRGDVLTTEIIGGVVVALSILWFIRRYWLWDHIRLYHSRKALMIYWLTYIAIQVFVLYECMSLQLDYPIVPASLFGLSMLALIIRGEIMLDAMTIFALTATVMWKVENYWLCDIMAVLTVTYPFLNISARYVGRCSVIMSALIVMCGVYGYRGDQFAAWCCLAAMVVIWSMFCCGRRERRWKLVFGDSVLGLITNIEFGYIAYLYYVQRSMTDMWKFSIITALGVALSFVYAWRNRVLAVGLVYLLYIFAMNAYVLHLYHAGCLMNWEITAGLGFGSVVAFCIHGASLVGMSIIGALIPVYLIYCGHEVVAGCLAIQYFAGVSKIFKNRHRKGGGYWRMIVLLLFWLGVGYVGATAPGGAIGALVIFFVPIMLIADGGL